MNLFINLSVIFWSLFPALMSYTQPASMPLKVELKQLVANSDLLIDSNSDNIPDGFYYANATNISLINGIAKFTATARDGRIVSSTLSSINIGDLVYQFCRVKTNRSSIHLGGLVQGFSLPSSNDFIFSSFVGISIAKACSILDTNTSGWTPIEVDYMGVINITDLVSKGFLPAGLSGLEYKILIDIIIVEVGGTFQGSYFYTETIADNYKWFSTGFVEKTGERDFIDYLGFFVWLVVPYLFAFLVYKLLKGVIYG